MAKGKNVGRVFLDVVVLVEEDDDLLLGDRWCALEEEEKGVNAWIELMPSISRASPKQETRILLVSFMVLLVDLIEQEVGDLRTER